LEFRADRGSRVLADLAQLFAGGWFLTRRIRDLRGRVLGRLRGTADFTPDRDGRHFAEHGILTLPQGQTEARRAYRFVIESADAFSVFFADGRFFHRAAIVSGTAPVTHDCAPDTYRGRYRFRDPDRWSLSWRITGPRKDLVISTVFSRHPISLGEPDAEAPGRFLDPGPAHRGRAEQ
jgi:Family of unknown function (DUF6314)